MSIITNLFRKLKVPPSATLLVILALAGGYYVGSKYVFGSGSGIFSNTPTAYAVRAYSADTNIPFIRHRVINLLMRNASVKEQVINNMDRILMTLGSEEYRLKALAEERASGAITPGEFRAKLFEIVKLIASSLGIALQPQSSYFNKVPDKMISMIEASQTGNIPDDMKTDALLARGYGTGRRAYSARTQERMDFSRRVNGMGNINIM